MYKLSNDLHYFDKNKIANVIYEGFEGIRKDRSRIIYSILLILIVLDIMFYKI